MPKLVHRNPKYSKHRASGQAVVTLDGQDYYLGAHGTKASRDEYDRLISIWLANGRKMPAPEGAEGRTVVEVISAYWKHVQTYYRKPDGTPTSEQDTIRQALHVLRVVYGRTPAADFGAQKLKALRREMIVGDPTPRPDGRPTRKPWCRTFVNKQIGRIRGMFKWAAEEELFPSAADVYVKLSTVKWLKAGRSAARESKPVKPVPEAHVYAIKDHVARQVWAMIELQLLTGMRPDEVCSIRGRDLDTTGDQWRYSPESHKTQHHGHSRTIYFGPRAKQIVGEYLKPDLAAHLFSPADAEAERLARLHANRKTPMSCGNRPGTNRTRSPKRKPGPRYTVASYRRAIQRGCAKADGAAHKARPDLPADQVLVPSWHPHQLRHNAATRLRAYFRTVAPWHTSYLPEGIARRRPPWQRNCSPTSSGRRSSRCCPRRRRPRPRGAGRR